MENLIDIGKQIYNPPSWKQYRRIAVFVCRSLLHKQQMQELMTFFAASKLRQEIVNHQPSIYELVTRQVLYYNSSFNERYYITKEHFLCLEKNFQPQALESIYLQNGLEIWQQEYKDGLLSLNIHYFGGHKKEGLIALELKINDHQLYQVIFWLGNDKIGNKAIFIGALQGSQGEQKTIKALTKLFYGYRTKNLILHALRCLARQLKIENIYAVSNAGFYANNHLRIDRKLKTSLDAFWEETGGKVTNDNRFYELPVNEYRKTMEEVVTHKRNLYRNRFQALDEMEAKIQMGLSNYLLS